MTGRLSTDLLEKVIKCPSSLGLGQSQLALGVIGTGFRIWLGFFCVCTYSPGCQMLVFCMFDRFQVDLVACQASILCWSKAMEIGPLPRHHCHQRMFQIRMRS